jgi:AraC family transcriptional regulator, transcriptional activator of the genes for pyochelin and ferripyochelin receptors
MPIILSEPERVLPCPSSSYLSSFELMIQSPTDQSNGYQRSLNLRHGLNLLIRDYWLQDILIEEKPPDPPGRILEFGFNMQIEPSDRLSSAPSQPASFLQWDESLAHSFTQEWADQRRVLKVDLHLITPVGSSTFSAEQLALLPTELQTALAHPEEDWYQPLDTISPAIQLVLQQILNCPYTGSIQQVYLEGKALELIALQTSQWLQLEPLRSHPRLKRSDVDRIHQARAIILRQFDNPPSLLELARAVGLNDCTLKRGFRQVFGTTVFGYLRQQRLNRARHLLQSTEMSILEVAHAVGYSHSGHFAAAFKREFGASPRAFRHSA